MVRLLSRNHEPTATAERDRVGARSAGRRYVVVANHTLGSAELWAVLAERAREQGVSFHLVVPAATVDDDGAALAAAEHLPRFDGETRGFALARYRLQRALAELRDLGLEATGEVGPPEAFEALTEALVARPVDEIIVSTLPAHVSGWHANGLVRHLRHAFPVEVTHVEPTGALTARHGVSPAPAPPV
jgi:hypothetical protein